MNLQNVLRDDPTVKRAFIPKREGGVLAEFDYSQIEPRLFGYFTAKLGLTRVAEMYRAGMDVYAEMAAKTLQTSEVTKKQRQDFKTFFLMLLYSAGPRKISEEMDMPYKQALDYYRAFHDAWPEVRLLSNPAPRKPYPGYERGAIERALARKGHLTLLDGRPSVPEPWGEFKMLNKLIQGSAAVVMKRALVRVHKHTKDWPHYAHPILTVHDQILMDAMPDELPMLAVEIPKLMDEPLINDIVPVVVEMKWSDVSWADVKEYE